VLRGRAWHSALPAGYGLALLGAPLFALSGVGDLAWHQLFGIERGVEALLSPTHLGLVASMLMIVSAPVRAALHRSSPRWRDQVPAVLALMLTLTLLTFISEYAHPFIEPMANEARFGSTGVALGVAGVIIQAAILAGVLIVAVRLPALPAGSFTLLMAGNAALIAVLNDQFWTVAVAGAAGVAADILYRALRPSEQRVAALRVFLTLVPAIVYLLYFLALMRVDVVFWRLHTWAGAIALAGAAGLLLAVLVTPQARQAGAAEQPARAA
jgi:hypothetical protein